MLGTKVIEKTITELEESNQLLFYEQVFDTNLLSESSNSYNLGFQYFISPSFPIEINLFRNNIFNLIESSVVGRKTNGQTIYSYSNLNKILTQGIEIQGSCNPIKRLSINGGYQMLYARDHKAVKDFESELVYARDPISKQSFLLKKSDYFGLFGRSRHQLNFNFGYDINNNKDYINFRINYKGKFGLIDTNNNSFLDNYDRFVKGHIIANISYNKSIGKFFDIQFLIKNMLNYKDDENLMNNPGRVYSLRISFNN